MEREISAGAASAVSFASFCRNMRAMNSDMTQIFERGNLHELAAFLTTPARSGVFLTRSRIRGLAREMGLRAGVQNRARMLENLFREAGSDGRAPELLRRIDEVAGRSLAQYRAWAQACPPARGAWRDWARKARALRRHLAEARKRADAMREDAPSSAPRAEAEGSGSGRAGGAGGSFA